MFAGEAVRLLKLKVLPLVTLHLRLLASAWRLVEKHHIHQVDALQITSANHVGANELYTGGEDLHKAASAEGVRGVVLK